MKKLLLGAVPGLVKNGDVRRSPFDVRRRTQNAEPRTIRLAEVREQIISCERCPRLRSYCTEIARTKKKAHRDEIPLLLVSMAWIFLALTRTQMQSAADAGMLRLQVLDFAGQTEYYMSHRLLLTDLNALFIVATNWMRPKPKGENKEHDRRPEYEASTRVMGRADELPRRLSTRPADLVHAHGDEVHHGQQGQQQEYRQRRCQRQVAPHRFRDRDSSGPVAHANGAILPVL